MRTFTFLLASIFVASAASFACDNGSAEALSSADEAESANEESAAADNAPAEEPAAEEPAAEEPAAEEPAAEEPRNDGSGEAAALPMVQPTAEGARFEPPVRSSQVPAGSWICDMGTVHFARTEQGDGECAICGMNLVHHQ